MRRAQGVTDQMSYWWGVGGCVEESEANGESLRAWGGGGGGGGGGGRVR